MNTRRAHTKKGRHSGRPNQEFTRIESEGGEQLSGRDRLALARHARGAHQAGQHQRQAGGFGDILVSQAIAEVNQSALDCLGQGLLCVAADRLLARRSA